MVAKDQTVSGRVGGLFEHGAKRFWIRPKLCVKFVVYTQTLELTFVEQASEMCVHALCSELLVAFLFESLAFSRRRLVIKTN